MNGGGYGGGGGGFANPMTTLDDLIVGGAAGAAARLGKGVSATVLTIDPATGHVAWDAVAFVNPMSAPGDLIQGGSAGAPLRLAVGSAGSELAVVAGQNYGVTSDGAANHYILFASDAGLPAGNPAGVTLAAWIKTASNVLAPILKYGATGSNDHQFAVYSAVGGFTAYVGADSAVAAAWAGAYADNAWHFVCLTWDGANFHVWLDGVDLGAKAATRTPNVALTEIVVGGDEFGAAFGGTIARPAIFPTVLSAANIAKLFNDATAPGATYDTDAINLGALRLYGLGEATGTTTAADLSPSHVNGTYQPNGLTRQAVGPITSAPGAELTYLPNASAVAQYSAGVDQTASRALNTDYTNGLRRRRVFVVADCAATVANAAYVGAEYTAGGTAIDNNNDAGAGAGAIVTVRAFVSFCSDPGTVYAVNSSVGGTSTATLVRWVEVDE